jgi:hypothetical protein
MTRFVLVASLALSLYGCGSSKVLTDPPMITSSGMADPTYVRAAVLSGMARRRWVAERDDPGVVLARFDHGGHQARVWVRYDASNVVIQYADSTNLNFRLINNTPYIHKAYNKWVLVLSREIHNMLACGQRCMARYQPMMQGPVIVPQPIQPQPVAPVAPVAPQPAPAAPAPAPAPTSGSVPIVESSTSTAY